jgi:hypothetical protein
MLENIRQSEIFVSVEFLIAYRHLIP